MNFLTFVYPQNGKLLHFTITQLMKTHQIAIIESESIKSVHSYMSHSGSVKISKGAIFVEF